MAHGGRALPSWRVGDSLRKLPSPTVPYDPAKGWTSAARVARLTVGWGRRCTPAVQRGPDLAQGAIKNERHEIAAPNEPAPGSRSGERALGAYWTQCVSGSEPRRACRGGTAPGPRALVPMARSRAAARQATARTCATADSRASHEASRLKVLDSRLSQTCR
jgi:hypothetical protein